MYFHPLIVSIMAYIISYFTYDYICEGVTRRKDEDTGDRVMWSTYENALGILQSRPVCALLNLYIIVTD